MSVARVIELWGGVTRQQRLAESPYLPLVGQAPLYIVSRQPKVLTTIEAWDGEYVDFTVNFDGRSFAFHTDLNALFRRKVGRFHQEFRTRNDGYWIHFEDSPPGRDDQILSATMTWPSTGHTGSNR